jgi:hypothetical protein
MMVTEYRDHFLQLARYAPAEVANDGAKEERFREGLDDAVFTEKSLRLLGKNQYTFNVESGFTKTEIKHWVELFFGVKVVAVNSHRLPGPPGVRAHEPPFRQLQPAG